MSDSWNWHSDPLYERNVWWDYQHPGTLVRIADDLARVHSDVVEQLHQANVLVPVRLTGVLHSAEKVATRVKEECFRQSQERIEQSRLYQRLIAEGLCP